VRDETLLSVINKSFTSERKLRMAAKKGAKKAKKKTASKKKTAKKKTAKKR